MYLKGYREVIRLNSNSNNNNNNEADIGVGKPRSQKLTLEVGPIL